MIALWILKVDLWNIGDIFSVTLAMRLGKFPNMPRTAFRRTFEQATRAFGFPPFVKSPRTAVLRRRKVPRRTRPRPKERLRPIAPGCTSALKNFYFVRRVFSCRTVSPSGSGSTPRISETVCPRRAFEPAGTDWLKTVPAPENETIIPCRSSR